MTKKDVLSVLLLIVVVFVLGYFAYYYEINIKKQSASKTKNENQISFNNLVKKDSTISENKDDLIEEIIIKKLNSINVAELHGSATIIKDVYNSGKYITTTSYIIPSYKVTEDAAAIALWHIRDVKKYDKEKNVDSNISKYIIDFYDKDSDTKTYSVEYVNDYNNEIAETIAKNILTGEIANILNSEMSAYYLRRNEREKEINNSKVTNSITQSQIQASKKAKEYLNIMAFSAEGLIKQLEFDKFSEEDSEYAVEHCGANWKEQAKKKAKEYLSLMAFSHDRLVEQLEYDGFTEEEAEYGVSLVGL